MHRAGRFRLGSRQDVSGAGSVTFIVRRSMTTSDPINGSRRLAALGVLNACLVIWLPNMARAKGWIPYFGQWIGASLAFAMIVLALGTMRHVNWPGRTAALGFCALPIVIIWDV